MYIHLGSKKTVKDSYVIGFFDLEREKTPKITGEFLKRAEKEGIISSAGDDIPRSFVLCADKKGEEVILSHISTVTLRERGETRETMETKEYDVAFLKKSDAKNFSKKDKQS